MTHSTVIYYSEFIQRLWSYGTMALYNCIIIIIIIIIIFGSSDLLCQVVTNLWISQLITEIWK